MPKQTQAKASSELDKAAEAYAAATDKAKRLVAERDAARQVCERLEGELQTAKMDLDAAEFTLRKVALGQS